MADPERGRPASMGGMAIPRRTARPPDGPSFAPAPRAFHPRGALYGYAGGSSMRRQLHSVPDARAHRHDARHFLPAPAKPRRDEQAPADHSHLASPSAAPTPLGTPRRRCACDMVRPPRAPHLQGVQEIGDRRRDARRHAAHAAPHGGNVVNAVRN